MSDNKLSVGKDFLTAALACTTTAKLAYTIIEATEDVIPDTLTGHQKEQALHTVFLDNRALLLRAFSTIGLTENVSARDAVKRAEICLFGKEMTLGRY